MFKQRHTVISDLVDKKSVALPSTVVAQQDQRVAGETRMTGGRHLRCVNRAEHITRERSGMEADSKPVQLATLSKAVDRAFTSWTIKTQK